MDLIWSFGLFVCILFAWVFMCGGKTENLFRHLTRFITHLLVTIFRVVLNLISYGFTAGARNLKLDGLTRARDDRHREFHQPTKKRW